MADDAPVRPGYQRINAYLCVDGADEAIAFYRSVFGATERIRIPMADGRIGHAELVIGDAVLMISDEFADMGVVSPTTLGGTTTSLNVYVADPDATHAAALAAGARELRAVEDQFHGDRSGQFVDPWGHRWNVAKPVENVTPGEIVRRAAELFGDS